MKREIKFRAWDPVLHRFASAYDTVYIESDGEVVIIDTIGGLNRVGYDIQLFTGLKDKNDKEIYEGDILLTGLHDTLIVQWNQLHCGWYLFSNGLCKRDLQADEYNNKGELLKPWQSVWEVIGNIYENPELLNQ